MITWLKSLDPSWYLLVPVALVTVYLLARLIFRAFYKSRAEYEQEKEDKE